MARVQTRALPAALMALAFCCSLHVLSKPGGAAFLPASPQRLRGDAAATLAAAVVAGAAAAPHPADAAGMKFSVFGFGEGASDAYSQLDADAATPYSPFSNPKNSIYTNADKTPYKAARKEKLQKQIDAIENGGFPELIRTKNSEEIKSRLTLLTYTMRANMDFLSGDPRSDAAAKAREFGQAIADLGADAAGKIWSSAPGDYAKSLKLLNEWKTLAKY